MPYTNSTTFAGSKKMDSPTTQFMVDFTLPELLTDDFISTIPYQRAAVNRLFSEGKLLNYALSLENSKLWAVFSARSEAELMELVTGLPLSRFMRVRISELTFFDVAHPFTAAFSVN